VFIVDCTEISSFCCVIRLVCSEARVWSMRNPRISGWVNRAETPELNWGFRMLFDAGVSTRVFVQFRFQLPPPFHRFCWNPDDQPLVFLYWRDSLPVVASRIHGVLPGPAGIGWNFTDWFVPKQLQRYTSG